uniref:ubiquitinyl hydrolase 1 n=1 Tax=Otolemur garnettii TaxID=30611 RepID=H0XHE8_OTOGA
MALHNPQCIFGGFSPDEFNQVSVTPCSSVEIPPYSGTGLCSIWAADPLPDPQEYQRIEFGVNEVIEPNDSLPRSPSYSISSTLNPQAPEFIPGCTTSKPSPDGIDKEASYSSTDCQSPGSALAEDSSCSVEVEVLENNGLSGGLGQREPKKKKKQLPVYSSYPKDGGERGPVNGHANSAAANSISIEDAGFVGDLPLSVTPGTCDSPQNSTDSVSDSGAEWASGKARSTQPEGVHGTDFDQSCFPGEAGRDNLLRTAGAQPYVGTNTTEDPGVANGQILESSGEGTAANGVELHTMESIDLDPAKPEHASPPADGVSVSGALPVHQPKCWTSLFHDSKPSSSSLVAYVEKYSPPTMSPLASEKQVEVKIGLGPVSEDSIAIKVAELLEDVTLIHKPVSLQPHELINRGNWCYINTTLQALVAYPPMYHLMKFIPLYSKGQRPCMATSMISVWLMNEFTNMPVAPKSRQALGGKVVRDIRLGLAFVPTYIYRLLTMNKSSLSEKGCEEDAEEYLGFILNVLHEEMWNLKILLSPYNENLMISNRPKSHSLDEYEQEEQDRSEDEWEQAGPRSKTSVTRQAASVQTPITISGGHIRSVVYQQRSKECATLQPFFTLQLDIQSDQTHVVQGALERLVARESVQGYTTEPKQEVEISQRVSLEKLPPVLVLHLKRFVYEKTGECQKLKNIHHPVDLEISKELSPGVKNKNFKCYRTYWLFAVVCHHSGSPTAGHYTMDVFWIGLNGLLRCLDDQTVKVINQYQVVKPAAEHTAYLLYYRRGDLL